jgi:TolB-like protein/Flp pilus assembly protein TadD
MGRVSPATNRTIQFGVFEVDLRAGELRRRGVKVKLQEQPLQILQILLQSPGDVVTREELQQRIWPADTFVDFDHGINNAIKRLREALGDTAERPRYIETLPRRGYRFIGPIESRATGRIQSLAVLPLENLSRDPEQEYFADGMTESLITSLAKISALRVISRTTALKYKGVRDRSAQEIARELGVDCIVEGTVLRSGERVRISAQLINAATDTHLWAEEYERDLRDILALQSEVARAVANEIRVKLTPREQDQLARTRPVNPDAYEAYLKGRYYWDKRRPDAVKKGAEYFKLAIEKDPTYAAAYAGLADSAGAAGFWGFAPPEETYAKAKIAAQKSLQIEETAEAHTSLGFALLHYDYDFLGAEKQFQRAIELNWNYATAHQWYAHCHAYLGRLDQCLEEATQALQLDPLSLIINTTFAGRFWFAREWDRAIEHCHKGLELDPSFAAMRWMLANVYQGKGMYQEAICEREKAIELGAGAPVFTAELGATYAAAGQRDKALEALNQLQELSKQRYVMAYWIALIHTGLKEKDAAFAWLEKAYRERSATLAFAKVDPRLDCLRSDPRFQDLMRRMNFPP